jgi:magnesium transporter
MTMLTFQLFHKDQNMQTIGGVELLERWHDDIDTVLWLDIDGALEDSTAELLQQQIGLHALALQDASRDRHPPKIEDFDGYTFLIFKGLSADSDSIDCSTIQIALFVGERFLVSRHSGESFSINHLRQEVNEDTSLFSRGPGAMTARLGRLMVNRYLRILLDLEPRLEFLEETLMGESGDAVLAELVKYKSDLIRLQRIFYYHIQVVSELNDSLHPGFSTEEKHELTDVYEQQERVGSLCNMYYQLATDLIEGYISVSSHRLNQIMRVLTIITAIFVPLSFLAGIYGMNFENMPELHSPWGYFGLIGVMALIATSLLYLFYSKKWFH